ncbi:hypothetical protein [Corallococcus macrosporus]|uniref:Lipase n=1 Tax=Corallococcus macrosporus DSM 14697 TaxID=1189310 RepID=A0A250JUK5_9BACT|nr:hypothetical protein [Corallococcus macrosporus]ATB47338.1 lipase [Corallococcus macrosporus DSM 14697]
MSVNDVALGDSTAVGVGGYPEHLASRLRAGGLPVGLSNLGQSGPRRARW